MAVKIVIGLENEFEYFKYLVETINLYCKYKSPDKVIRGREIDLLCWMAVGSDHSKTLKGAPFRDWLTEKGNFTNNDIYRYTSSLVKKGWLSEALLKITSSGSVMDAKEGDIDALEGYKFRSSIFDKKRSQLSLEMILNIRVDEKYNQGEEQVGSRNGDSHSVSDSSPRTVHSAL